MPEPSWKKHERAVAAAFSRWISQSPPGVKPPAVISRQALHGRMVERLWGDLAVHPDCPERWMAAASWFMNWAMVDAKRRKAFSLPAVLRSPAHEMFDWWAKLSGQAPSDRMRLMVLEDRQARLLVYGHREAAVLESQCGDGLFPCYRLRPLAAAGVDETLTICHLEAFLHALEPAAFGCPPAANANPA